MNKRTDTSHIPRGAVFTPLVLYTLWYGGWHGGCGNEQWTVDKQDDTKDREIFHQKRADGAL